MNKHFRDLRAILDENTLNPDLYTRVHAAINSLEFEMTELRKSNDKLQYKAARYLIVRMYANGFIKEVVDRSIKLENSNARYREFWIDEIRSSFSDAEAELCERSDDYLNLMKEAWRADFPQDEDDAMLLQIELYPDGPDLYEVLNGQP